MSSQGTGAAAVENPIKRTEELLVLWGHWLRSIGISPGVTRMDLMRRQSVIRISDEQGLLMDGLVCRLIIRDTRMGTIVRDAYYCQKSDIEMGVEWGRNRDTIAKWREAGIMWIDGMLEEKLQKV